jgi:hypothetical protein
MHEKDDNFSTRRAMLTGIGVAAAGVIGSSMATANAQGNAPPFRARRHAEDSWLGDVGGDHRVFIDSARAVGGIEAVHYAGNILDAHKSTYGGSDSDYAMFICYRRFSTPLGYNDAVWEKYGTFFNKMLKFPDPATGEPFAVNPLNIPGRMDLPSMGATIQSVADRGVHFAVCAGATRGISHMLAQATDGSADDIFKEMTSSGIVNSRFVPAGVMAATRAQEYGYTLLYSGE